MVLIIENIRGISVYFDFVNIQNIISLQYKNSAIFRLSPFHLTYLLQIIKEHKWLQAGSRKRMDELD